MRRSLMAWVWAGALLLALAGCGPKSMQARMEAGERASDRALSAMDDSEKALAAGDLDRAEARIKEADRELANPDVSTNPEAEMLKSRLAELKVKVPEARKQREKEELAKRVAARREIVARSVTQFRKAITAMEEKPGDAAAVKAAREAAKKVHDDVEWDKELPAKDPEFKGYLDGLRQDLQEGDKSLAMAEKVLEFLNGPVKERDLAAADAPRARAEKDPEQKVTILTQVQDHYRACAGSGEKAIAATPGLEKATVTMSPKRADGATVVKECKEQAEAVAKLLVPARKLADAAAKKAEAAKKKAEAAAAKKAAKSKTHARR